MYNHNLQKNLCLRKKDANIEGHGTKYMKKMILYLHMHQIRPCFVCFVDPSDNTLRGAAKSDLQNPAARKFMPTWWRVQTGAASIHGL